MRSANSPHRARTSGSISTSRAVRRRSENRARVRARRTARSATREPRCRNHRDRCDGQHRSDPPRGPRATPPRRRDRYRRLRHGLFVALIAQGFVADAATDLDDAAIALTNFDRRSLRVRIARRGARDRERGRVARAHGCRYVQGYAIGHPLPLTAFTTWLADHDDRRADASGA